MDNITPTERIISTLEGKPADRVPVLCLGFEDRTSQEVLGKPLIPASFFTKNPAINWLMDRGWRVNNRLLRTVLSDTYLSRVKAAIKLGFDSMWLLSGAETLIIDSKTMATMNGMIYTFIEDDFGNADYMYKGPALTSRQVFEEWPHFAAPAEFGERIFNFFKKAVKQYGDEICILGQSACGMHEGMLGAIGFERAPLWIRKEKDLIKRYIDWNASICFSGAMAMMDAGVKVVLQGDDFAHKTGPTFNPKLVDELIGAHYKRLTKAVHDRGGRIILHSCGDNTLLFDSFISWGYDGCHAYEPTSNVDIFKEKKLHGDKITIIGNVGVDYLLTERSKDEEVVEEVKRLIEGLAPGGRYILSPAHVLNSIPAHKLKVMIDAAHEFGKYSGATA
jgi:uroporphyrinogen-III decarboxylase